MNSWPVAMSVVQVLGWSLVHFLWQAVLIGALYALIRPRLARGEARYLLGILALLALSLCPLLTAWQLLSRLHAVVDSAPVFALTSSGMASTVAGLPSGRPAAWQSSIDALLPWLVLAWVCGVALLTLRVWRHWRRLKILVRGAQVLPIWQERVRGLARSFGLRCGVRVLSSARVATPALVGWICPVILLPIAVSCGFPVAQIELILAHELAHLRRFDHLANLFQVILETLLFYHPVVHWISRDVRNERELCCDALALRITGGNRREFASALVELEEFRDRHAGLSLAASGGVLRERVWQITGPTPDAAPARPPTRFVGVLSGLLLAALLLALMWQQAQVRLHVTAAADRLLNAQLLPAAIRVPAMAIANLVPDHMQTLPSPIAVRARDVAHAEAADTAPPMARLRLAPIAVSAAILPQRMALAPLSIPAAIIEQPPLASVPAVAPRPVLIEQPIYPRSALEQGIEGRVVVEFGLNANGSVNMPVVVSAQSNSVFDRAAIRALLGWRFAVPAGEDGRRFRQTFDFALHPAHGAAMEEQVSARATCRTVTGSHICRTDVDPDEAFGARVIQPVPRLD